MCGTQIPVFRLSVVHGCIPSIWGWRQEHQEFRVTSNCKPTSRLWVTTATAPENFNTILLSYAILTSQSPNLIEFYLSQGSVKTSVITVYQPLEVEMQLLKVSSLTAFCKAVFVFCSCFHYNSKGCWVTTELSYSNQRTMEQLLGGQAMVEIQDHW